MSILLRLRPETWDELETVRGQLVSSPAAWSGPALSGRGSSGFVIHWADKQLQIPPTLKPEVQPILYRPRAQR